jgi:hypothetical protein
MSTLTFEPGGCHCGSPAPIPEAGFKMDCGSVALQRVDG